MNITTGYYYVLILDEFRIIAIISS